MATLTLFLRNILLFVSAYPRYIEFGSTEHQEIIFTFDLGNIKAFYKSFLKIVQLLRGNSSEENGDKITDVGENSYFWKISKPDQVCFLIKRNDKMIGKIDLNYLQFNELLYTVYQSLILSISVQNSDAQFVHFILDMEIKNILSYTSLEKFNNLLAETSFATDSYKYFIFYNYYLEIFFILMKFKKFCNLQLLPNNLEPILSLS